MTTINDPWTEMWLDPTTGARSWFCDICPDRHVMSTLDSADEFGGRALVQRHGDKVHVQAAPADFWLTGPGAASLGELLATKPRQANEFGNTLIAFGLLSTMEAT